MRLFDCTYLVRTQCTHAFAYACIQDSWVCVYDLYVVKAAARLWLHSNRNNCSHLFVIIILFPLFCCCQRSWFVRTPRHLVPCFKFASSKLFSEKSEQKYGDLIYGNRQVWAFLTFTAPHHFHAINHRKPACYYKPRAMQHAGSSTRKWLHTNQGKDDSKLLKLSYNEKQLTREVAGPHAFVDVSSCAAYATGVTWCLNSLKSSLWAAPQITPVPLCTKCSDVIEVCFEWSDSALDVPAQVNGYTETRTSHPRWTLNRGLGKGIGICVTDCENRQVGNATSWRADAEVIVSKATATTTRRPWECLTMTRNLLSSTNPVSTGMTEAKTIDTVSILVVCWCSGHTVGLIWCFQQVSGVHGGTIPWECQKVITVTFL